MVATSFFSDLPVLGKDFTTAHSQQHVKLLDQSLIRVYQCCVTTVVAILNFVAFNRSSPWDEKETLSRGASHHFLA